MPVKISGVLAARNMFLRMDTTAKKRVRASLIKKAHEIAALARKMAPRDVGNLEQAIKVRGDSPERGRDEGGRFSRVEIEVYVDAAMPVPERPGKTVGDYAWEVHEHLTPVGPNRLGPHSVAKQMGQTEVVGGGFLERAVDAVDKAIDKELLDILHHIV